MKFRIPDCQLSRIDKNPPAHPAADPLVESSISAEPTSLKSVAQCTASSAQPSLQLDLAYLGVEVTRLF
jgi:hypothetical protein